MNATFETARQIHQIGGGRVIIGSGSLVGAASLMVAPSVHQRHQLTNRRPFHFIPWYGISKYGHPPLHRVVPNRK